jgi:hypothetical protein
MKKILIEGRSQWLLNRSFLHKCFSTACGNLSLFSLLFIGLLSLSTTTVQGQSISRQVIGITGGSTATSFGSISWTVGQTAVKHVKSSDQKYSITQGFQQPNIQVVPAHTFDNPMVSIAPNPVIDILNITVLNPQAENTNFNLIDQLGRVLISNGNLKAWSNELNLSIYPAGTYLLQVHQADEKMMQTYKVLKVQ